MPTRFEVKRQHERNELAVAQAVASLGCAGGSCTLDPDREAYLFIWSGTITYPPPRRAIDGAYTATLYSGLRAAVSAIRVHDTRRPIVVQVLDPRATTYAPLVALQEPFAPLDITLVPELPAWDLAHVHPSCNRHTRFLIREVSKYLLGEERALPMHARNATQEAVLRRAVELFTTHATWEHQHNASALWQEYDEEGVPRLRAFAERLRQDAGATLSGELCAYYHTCPLTPQTPHSTLRTSNTHGTLRMSTTPRADPVPSAVWVLKLIPLTQFRHHATPSATTVLCIAATAPRALSYTLLRHSSIMSV